MSEEYIAGDIVAVIVQPYGRREGMVLGTHYDLFGQHIVEVQFEPGDMYYARYPTVTRIRRTTYHLPPVRRTTTVQRQVYW